MRISDWSSDVCSSDLQEDKVHVVGIGSKEVLALVIDRLESNPQFLEHRASSSRLVRVHVDCDEVDIRGLAEIRNDPGRPLPSHILAGTADLDHHGLPALTA